MYGMYVCMYVCMYHPHPRPQYVYSLLPSAFMQTADELDSPYYDKMSGIVIVLVTVLCCMCICTRNLSLTPGDACGALGTCMHKYVCVCVCVYVCMHACMHSTGVCAWIPGDTCGACAASHGQNCGDLVGGTVLRQYAGVHCVRRGWVWYGPRLLQDPFWGMQACVYTFMHVFMYARMYVCMYVCMHVCTYVCTYVCMYYAHEAKDEMRECGRRVCAL